MQEFDSEDFTKEYKVNSANFVACTQHPAPIAVNLRKIKIILN